MNYLVAAAGGALVAMLVQWLLRARSGRAAKSRWAPRTGSFRSFRGLIVPDARGTTEIDEVVVTPAGVFVIEKKDFGAWIYGDVKDEDWTAVYGSGEKFRFQNPIRQNYRHLKALESFLQIRRSPLSSIVSFSDRSRLMTAMPPEVVNSDYVGYVESRRDVALSPDEFDAICARLSTLELRFDGAALDRHVEGLHQRFESTTRCPKCGGTLVQRQSRKPGYEGNVFLGCSSYPRCRYIRNLEP